MLPSIRPGKKEASNGKGDFPKPSLALVPPPDGARNSPKSSLLGASAAALSVANARGKVALKPGRSLIDWMRLGKSGKDLAGTNGKILKVTTEELARHNKEDDCWMVLNGVVYNVAPYMEFHPGGIPELLRGAGIDGTQLFNEVHRWVNYESMLAKCIVGKYIPSATNTPQHTGEKSDLENEKSTLVDDNGLQAPRCSWSQTDATVTITINAEKRSLQRENIILDRSDRLLHVRLLIDDEVYHFEQELEDTVGEMTVSVESEKIDVTLQKENPGRQWQTLGKDGPRHSKRNKKSDEDIDYRQCTVSSVTSVTHDTNLYCLEYPEATHMVVPTGRHVFVSMDLPEGQVTREYTVVPPTLLPDRADARVAFGRVLHLMIKIYSKGLLTPALGHLKPGDKLGISSTYAGNFKTSKLQGITDLIMYAAGTGFTPMASLLNHCLKDSSAATISRIQLVFCNKQEKDILWRDELDAISSNTNRFVVHHVLSDPHPDWTGLTGRIRKELIESLSPKPQDMQKVLFCVCGPVPFTQQAMRLAGELGYSDDELFAFTS